MKPTNNRSLHASIVRSLNRSGLADMYGALYITDSHKVTSFILRKARAALKRETPAAKPPVNSSTVALQAQCALWRKACAGMMATAMTNGAYMDSDMIDFIHTELAGEKRTPVQVWREAVGM